MSTIAKPSNGNGHGVENDLCDAFARLDERKLVQLARTIHDPAHLNDAGRIALSFGLLADGNVQRFDALLGTITGDGTAPLADLAFIRAFRYSIDDNHAAAIQTMAHHLDDAKATHPAYMRLRLADSLLKLGRHAELKQVLQPYTEPPGNEHTLEAALIIADSMLRNKIGGEALIEQVALIDVLLERGFRLAKIQNVIYYANLLHLGGVEGIVASLLTSHSDVMRFYTPSDGVEIEFLLSMGQKHKVPEAVHAAARGFLAEPVQFKSFDPEEAAYLFTSHEEHLAAREAILAHFTKSTIRKTPGLARTMIILNFYSAHWKDALDLIIENRRDLQSADIYAESMRIRAACEYRLGRFDECLATARALAFDYVGESASTATAESLAALATVQPAAFELAVRKVVTNTRYQPEDIRTFFGEIMMEVIVRENKPALATVIYSMEKYSPDSARRSVQDILSHEICNWTWIDSVEVVAASCARLKNDFRCGQVLAFKAVEEGREADALRFVDAIIAENTQHAIDMSAMRTNILRRFGRLDAALAECNKTIQRYPNDFEAYGRKSGLLRQMSRPADQAGADAKHARKLIESKARDRNEFDRMMARLAIAEFHDTTVDRYKRLCHIAEAQFDSEETLRLARQVLRAFDATEEMRVRAEKIQTDWIENHLKPVWKS